jgi:hypothetical protein
LLKISYFYFIIEALKGGSAEIFENKSKEAATYLTKAAGIFEFIGYAKKKKKKKF